MECARLLLEEAKDSIENSDEDIPDVQRIYSALTAEFQDETVRLNGAPNLGIDVDSVYTRMTEISGAPLDDGFNFGQTIINDYGRPYGEGFNNVTGFTSHGVLGPLTFYVRAEYQHAASGPGLSSQAAQAIPAIEVFIGSANHGHPAG